ncbi:MAG: NlpC/P60 family protein [Leptospiraceae bacterium]|nr:NlpC/P60 family protein [Leptospiraceae bacterium]
MKFLGLILFFWCISIFANSNKLTKEEKTKLREEFRYLATFNIKYGKEWKEVGSKKTLHMDCSNTVKFVFQKLFGLNLPRSSYDQYLFVKNLGNLSTPPLLPNGQVDSSELEKKLKVGDLLFWINTHSDIPKDRYPPIGHVMVYLGKTKSGNLKMGGASTFGPGERTKNGGVDIFPFDPNAKIGCVKDSRKNCVKMSMFVGFGKPKIR